MTADPWGITQLNASTGREWFSNWHTATSHSWDSKGTNIRSEDPQDSSFDLHCKDGEDGIKNSAIVDATNDRIEFNGRTPRGYINDAAEALSWRNIEWTGYFKGMDTLEGGGAFVVARFAGRTNHHKEYFCVSSGIGYSLEFKLNGTIQLRKEVVHPGYSDDVYASVFGYTLNTWIGAKLVLQNIGSNTMVRGYMDTTDGASGGTWDPIVEKFDKGDWAMTDPVDLDDFNSANSGSGVCVKATSPTMINHVARVSCYMRCDNVRTQFKKCSIREIAAL